MTSRPMILMGVLILGCALLLSRPGEAAPSIFSGKGQTFGGIDGEYQYRQLEGKDTYSTRFGFTACYGLTRWLDVDGRAGVSQLAIEFPGTKVSSFEGTYKFGGGVGARVKVMEVSRVTVYGEGQAYVFFSEDDITQDVVGGQMRANQSWEWREAEGAVGVSVDLGVFSVYAGGSMSVIQTFKDSEKRLFETSGKTGDLIVSPTEEYRSDPLTDLAFVGAVFQLPREFKLNIKLKGPDEVSLYVGLTQLYRGGPGAF